MLVPVKALGGYVPLNKNGLVINIASRDNIPSKWLPLVGEVMSLYRQNLGGKLHSIYLRGSVVQGNPMDNIADLDSFALITQKGIRWEKAAWKQEKLLVRFPFVSDIEMMLSSYFSDIANSNPRLAVVMSTQSICIWGEDLIPSLPLYKPGRDMMIYQRWLQPDSGLLRALPSINKPDCQQFMKLILRVGFELVMAREGKYTNDLYWCYQSFSKYYPSWSNYMYQALFYFLNPVNDKKLLQKNIKKLCDWMTAEIPVIITSNPNH